MFKSKNIYFLNNLLVGKTQTNITIIFDYSYYLSPIDRYMKYLKISIFILSFLFRKKLS